MTCNNMSSKSSICRHCSFQIYMLSRRKLDQCRTI